MLTLVSGLPGTGKSTLATELGSRLDAIALSRDWAREELVPILARRRKWLSDAVPRALRWGHPRWVQRRAADLLEVVVSRHLGQGRNVILEMVASPADRRRWASLAESHATPYLQVECFCSDSAAQTARVGRRSEQWPAILERMASAYAPPANGEAIYVDTLAPLDVCVKLVLREVHLDEVE